MKRGKSEKLLKLDPIKKYEMAIATKRKLYSMQILSVVPGIGVRAIYRTEAEIPTFLRLKSKHASLSILAQSASRHQEDRRNAQLRLRIGDLLVML
jgi:hypothetical protein